MRGGKTIRQNTIQTLYARSLRQDQTDAERALWQLLRNRRLGGYKFRRQVPIGPYVVDFYCAEARLIIELDDANRADCAPDLRRETWMGTNTFRVLRFWNSDILQNPLGVSKRIIERARTP